MAISHVRDAIAWIAALALDRARRLSWRGTADATLAVYRAECS